MLCFSPAFAESGWCVLLETLDAHHGFRLAADWVADCDGPDAAADLAQTLNAPLVVE